LMQELRLGLASTASARAQVSTLLERFLKLGAQVVSASLMTELDAIAGPIIRAGRTYGLDVPATRKLVPKSKSASTKPH